jgi:plastocyanin
MLRNSFLLVPMVILLLFLGACSNSDPNKLSVITTDHDFSPLKWSVTAGAPVTLELTNRGTEEHEWVLIKNGMEVTKPFDDDDEDKVFWEIEAEAGETKTGTFTAPTEPGTYTVVCGIPDHLEKGMEATLVVK